MRSDFLVDFSVRRALKFAALAAGTSASITFFPATTFAAAAEETELQEVVVTARFREENLQTTPLAISAFSEEDLQARSIVNVSDLGATVPNAFIRQQNSNFGPTQTIGMRGVIQTDFTYAFEPAVGVYIDDIYHGTLTGSTMDLLDLDRVEVLRGPPGHAVRHQHHGRRRAPDLQEAQRRRQRLRGCHVWLAQPHRREGRR
jgi:iron complex outermembrane receptor protein